MDPRFQIILWAATTPLINNRPPVVYTVNSTSNIYEIESLFLDYFEDEKIGWDGDYEWEEKNGFHQACVMNDIEAATFQMRHYYSYSTQTRCVAHFFDQRVPNVTELIGLQFEEVDLDADERYKDKYINTYVNECDCKTYKLHRNGTIGDQVLVHSVFTLIKVLGEHSYFHLQKVDEKYFKFTRLYEFPQEYTTLYME